MSTDVIRPTTSSGAPTGCRQEQVRSRQLWSPHHLRREVLLAGGTTILSQLGPSRQGCWSRRRIPPTRYFAGRVVCVPDEDHSRKQISLLRDPDSPRGR
jgi:hypothetical protein